MLCPRKGVPMFRQSPRAGTVAEVFRSGAFSDVCEKPRLSGGRLHLCQLLAGHDSRTKRIKVGRTTEERVASVLLRKKVTHRRTPTTRADVMENAVIGHNRERWLRQDQVSLSSVTGHQCPGSEIRCIRMGARGSQVIYLFAERRVQTFFNESKTQEAIGPAVHNLCGLSCVAASIYFRSRQEFKALRKANVEQAK